MRMLDGTLLKSLYQSFHRHLASRSLTLAIFARADVVRIHGIGRYWHGLREFRLKDVYYPLRLGRDIGNRLDTLLGCLNGRNFDVIAHARNR
jgi:hypothetical protein